MRYELNFQSEPFETYSEFDEESEMFETELADLEWEQEAGRRRRRRPRPAVSRARRGGRVVSTKRLIKSPLRPPIRPPRPPIRPPRPVIFPTFPVPAVSVVEPRPPRPPGPADAEPKGAEPAPAGGSPTPPSAEPSAEGSEHVRWVQDSLNRILGLRLPLDGIMGPEVRSAIRTFQERQGLPITGLVGPDTERALIAATASAPPGELEEPELFDTELEDQEWEEEINRRSLEYIRWVQQSLNRIMGLRLDQDGIMGSQTRSAIRSFQKREGLLVDGDVGPQTEKKLIACNGPRIRLANLTTFLKLVNDSFAAKQWNQVAIWQKHLEREVDLMINELNSFLQAGCCNLDLEVQVRALPWRSSNTAVLRLGRKLVKEINNAQKIAGKGC